MLSGLSKSILNPLVFLAAVVFACLLVVSTAITISILRQNAPGQPVGTAMLQVIEAPTSTSVAPTSFPTATLTPLPGTPLPPAPGVISVGAYVQIQGTGLDGLRLRSQPGLQGTVRFVAIEAEVFRVAEGPNDADGYTWWFLVAPYDESVQGWGVSNYLSIVQNP